MCSSDLGILPTKKSELRVHLLRKREVHQLVPPVYPVVRNSYGIDLIGLPLAKLCLDVLFHDVRVHTVCTTSYGATSTSPYGFRMHTMLLDTSIPTLVICGSLLIVFVIGIPYRIRHGRKMSLDPPVCLRRRCNRSRQSLILFSTYNFLLCFFGEDNHQRVAFDDNLAFINDIICFLL